MKRWIRSFFIALVCIGKTPHSKPKRYQLFVDGMGPRLSAFFRLLGFDLRMTSSGRHWFQMRDRRAEKKRTKRIVHALVRANRIRPLKG